MILIYLIDILEDNYNILHDRFKTNSVNMMKNRPPVGKKTKEISIYISLVESIRQPWKLSLGTTATLKLFVSHTGL